MCLILYLPILSGLQYFLYVLSHHALLELYSQYKNVWEKYKFNVSTKMYWKIFSSGVRVIQAIDGDTKPWHFAHNVCTTGAPWG